MKTDMKAIKPKATPTPKPTSRTVSPEKMSESMAKQQMISPKKLKKAQKGKLLEDKDTKELTAEEQLELHKTESEVDVEKNKFTCIVHRGDIVGSVYICPKCHSFYCHRCAKMLKSKGETCWSCENEITVELSEAEKTRLMKKPAQEIFKQIIEADPALGEIIKTGKSLQEVPRIIDQELTLLTPKELDKIDLIGFSVDEKMEFIKDLLAFDTQERKKIIEDLLKSKE